MTRLRVVLYLRLSSIQDDSTAIVRQERDLRTLAEREGWEVVRVLRDDGISGRKHRANVDEALRMLAEGEAEVLAVWKLDRWTRQGINAVGRLVDVLDARKGAVFVAHMDGLRSDQSAFRLVAAVLSEVARSEAESGVVRARNAMHYRKVEANKFAGGASVPFGYRSEPAPDGVGRVLVVNEAEAAVVRAMAARVLAGETLAGVKRYVSELGVPTSKSAARRAARAGEPTDGLDRGTWRSSTVRELLTSDTVLGRVTHRGDLVRDEHGLPRQVWEPILDLATVERLRDRLGRQTAPSLAYPEAKPKRGPRPGHGRASRLLSGVAFCAVCDRRLYVTTSGGKAIYACATSRNDGECPSPKINADGLDAHVAAVFLRVAGSWPEMDVVEGLDSGARDAALAEVEAALREATAAMLEDGADVAALAARVSALRARREEVRALPVTRERRTVLTGRTLAEAWEADDSVEWRRSVLSWGIDHVTVAPAYARGLSPIDPARVRIVPRGDVPEDYDAA